MIRQLFDHAKGEIKLSKPVPGSKDRTPYRKHLEALQAANPYDHYPDLDVPELPEELSPLWSYTLCFAPGAVSWCELKAWSDMVGVKLNTWQVRTIIALDLMRG